MNPHSPGRADSPVQRLSWALCSCCSLGCPPYLRVVKVTLFTDGSYNHLNNSGGWAAFVECKEGNFLRYGPTLKSCSAANHAELFAIWIAVKLAYQEWGDKIHLFNIISDSETALRHVQRGPLGSKNRDREMLRLRGKIHDIFKECGVQVIPEHVKAHRDPSLGYRFAKNNQVDYYATLGRKSVKGAGFLRPDYTGSDLKLVP